MITSKKLLCDFGDVVAVSQDFGGDIIFVVFNEMGMVFDIDKLNFWGESFFRKNNISAIGINTRSPNWYPGESMLLVVNEIKKYIGQRKIITYGFSQGAYGALKYSKALNASVSLAFSPMIGINPIDVEKFDRRFIRYYESNKANGEIIRDADIGGTIYIFFDSKFPVDAENARLLLKLPGTIPINCPFTNHDSVRLVTEGGIALALLTLFMSNKNVDLREVRRLIRQARGKSKTYLHGLARHISVQPNKHRVYAKRVINKFEPVQQDLYFSLISHCDADILSAEKIINSLSIEELNKVSLLDFWTLFNKANFDVGEMKIADAIVRHRFVDTFPVLHSVNTYNRLGRKDDSKRLLANLVLRKDIEIHCNHLIVFSGQANYPECIEELLSRGISKDNEIAARNKLVDIYIKNNTRAKAFSNLIILNELVKADDVLRWDVGRKLLAIGEASFALEIFNKLSGSFVDDRVRLLDRVQALVTLRYDEGVQLMENIINDDSLNLNQLKRLQGYSRNLKLSQLTEKILERIWYRDDATAKDKISYLRCLIENKKSYLAHFRMYSLDLSIIKESSEINDAVAAASKCKNFIVLHRLSKYRLRS
ncbi:MAG: hypothetical protein EWV59_02315 [Microcystis aeruginosa Ma_MB_F_20061100_S19D]|nr:MAG: hypothetical protein EWV59_02315 [Microcystis aeruginosa Ma_MB_F_20061100_S19D]